LVDFFEAAVAAVVGIGDVLWGFEGGVEGSDECEFGIGDTDFLEVAEVLGVHGDDVVEFFDVGFGVGGGLDGAGVWGGVGVVGGGAAGVDLEVVGEVALVDEVLEDALGERGAADIS